MYYIGIDLGTSAMKLLLMDEKGEIYRTVTEEYPLSFPHPGWSEQEPADWIRALKTGLSDLLEGYDASQVRAIGSGGQMHGLVALDENDEIIRPAILWNDGRTDRETEYLNSAIGKEVLSEATGNIAFAGFTAPKLLWMRENEPELFEKIDKIMLPKDYINYVLTGKHATDYSDASGMLLLDVKNRAWSDRMKDLCGLREEQLAGLFESYEPIGSLKPELAAELGLPETVLVAAGAGDNAAAAVGTGVLKEGTCSISIGTSGTVFIACDAFCTDPQNSLHAFAHADGRWHLMGCMLSADSCNNWFMKDILHTDNFSEEQAGITDEMLGRNRVYFLPYLMGERSPINDTDARSCFVGMSLDTSRQDMVLAVLEGVAFAIRDSLEAAKAMGVSIQSARVSGGGFKSPLWRKIFADVLNISLEVVASEQGPGMGGAMLAMTADGIFSSVEEAAESLVHVSEVIEPDPVIAARYENKYAVWHSIYPALKEVFPMLDRKGEK